MASLISISRLVSNSKGNGALNSKALTKVQSAVLIAIVAIAIVGGTTAYSLWNGTKPAAESIKIGVCGDLDMYYGKYSYQGVVMAVEQINAQGGILGRNLTVVSEDDDSETAPGDIAVATNALTKLITVDKADVVISSAGYVQVYQEICSQHQKIFFSTGSLSDNDTQRVLDDYGKFKYFFRPQTNASSAIVAGINGLLTLKNYTGFNKIAFLAEDVPFYSQWAAGMKNVLPSYGFEVVYFNVFPIGTADFTSYLSAIETSGAQILDALSVSQSGFSLVMEYAERQSPFVVWGHIGLAAREDFWDMTEGKGEFISTVGYPVTAGYPLTSKTLPTREAFVERWGEVPNMVATTFYDVVRFILPDAIQRAGTTETDAVIRALETVNVETSNARHFVFTSSHDGYVAFSGPNVPSLDYLVYCMYQWQNGTQVPVSPRAMMQEAGAAYKYPPWDGPWNK